MISQMISLAICQANSVQGQATCLCTILGCQMSTTTQSVFPWSQTPESPCGILRITTVPPATSTFPDQSPGSDWRNHECCTVGGRKRDGSRVWQQMGRGSRGQRHRVDSCIQGKRHQFRDGASGGDTFFRQQYDAIVSLVDAERLIKALTGVYGDGLVTDSPAEDEGLRLAKQFITMHANVLKLQASTA